MSAVIEVTDLKKSFGAVRAVDGVSFSVEEGSLFAYLGQNGAGKSTTISILSTALPKDAGDVSIAGASLDRNPGEIRKNIGLVFQNSVLDPLLTVRENLTVRAAFYGLRGKAWETRLSELTEVFSLAELWKRPFGKLSGGQKRRVDLARGLIHRPKVLFLDEPTTGLDPQTRGNVWEIVDRLRRERGTTVFLTTHYMEEAARADRVVILDAGKVAAEGSPTTLKNEYSGDYLLLYRAETPETTALLTAEGRKFSYRRDCYRVLVSRSDEAYSLLDRFPDFRADFEVVKGDMDDVFLNATGKKLGGDSDA